MGSSTTSHDQQLHIFVFPFLATGHMIALLEMARLIAERGVKVSYITTAGNVPRISHVVNDAAKNGHSMQILILPFPCKDVGLPAGCENTTSLPMTDDALEKFYNVIQLLRQPLEQLIRDHRPDCLLADELYPWTSDLAISLGIPRILFLVTSHFSVCVCNEIEYHDAHLNLVSDTEPFVVPGGLPHKIQLTKAELPKPFQYPKLVLDMFRDSERKSYGIVMNSFDELAPEYVEKLKKDGRKIWNVGPVTAQAGRGSGSSSSSGSGSDHVKGINSWLDAKEHKSVLYVAFGTECVFSNNQLREIALGLETSSKPFIWVLRGGGGGLDTIDECLPKGFEERVEGRGMILKTWAPQWLILNHPAVGGFLMQCGWNSTQEALASGLPMITWPLHSEQFITERLIVQVLGTGVTALEGVKRSVYEEQKEVVKAEAVKEAVDRVMGQGVEASEMRRRAEKYKELLRSVLEEGGSSYVNLTSMIEDLTVLAKERRTAEG